MAWTAMLTIEDIRAWYTQDKSCIQIVRARGGGKGGGGGEECACARGGEMSRFVCLGRHSIDCFMTIRPHRGGQPDRREGVGVYYNV